MEVILTPGFFWLSVIFGVIVFFFTFSQTFNFYCKLILYNVFVLISSTICIPYALIRPGEVTNTKSVSLVFRFCCSIFGLKWKIIGREYLTGKEPCVVLCNHQSSIDVLGMMHVWPILDRCVPMIKNELRYFSGPFGILAALCGSVFIDRFNPDKAKETANKTVSQLKKKNTKLWVFPEGTRNADGSMLPFKKGAFHIAVQGQLPILPMVFSSYSKCYDKKKKIFKSGEITITVLPPVSTVGLTSNDVNSLVEKIRNQMLETFNKTSKTETTGKKYVNGTK